MNQSKGSMRRLFTLRCCFLFEGVTVEAKLSAHLWPCRRKLLNHRLLEPLLALQSFSCHGGKVFMWPFFLGLPVSGWAEVKGQGSLLTSQVEVEKMKPTSGGLVIFVLRVSSWFKEAMRWRFAWMYVGKIRLEHMQTFSNDCCQFESAQPHLGPGHL